MPNFAFQARDRSGEIVSGTREAGDQRQALEALREAGLFVTRLQAAPATAKKRGAETSAAKTVAAEKSRVENVATTSATSGFAETSGTPLVAPPLSAADARSQTAPHFQAAPPAQVVPVQWMLRANAKEVSLFFRQLHAMLHAGTSLGQALNIMAQHGTSKAIRRASAEMSLHTQRGGSLSEAMRAYPGLFSGLALGMVEAGERGGILESAFVRLADYSEHDYELQQSIRRETWYPKLLLACSFLIPSAVPLFLGGWGAWWISVRMQITIIAAVIVAWYLLGFLAPLLRGGLVRRGLDFLKLCVPGMSGVVRKFATVRFCRALGALYGAGVAPHRSVQMAAAACGNKYIEGKVMSVAPALERGLPISEALGNTGQFPAVAMQILHTGEATGTLDTQLDKVADFLESDAHTTLKKAVQLLGVLVLLVVGVIIGMKVIEFYTGYFNQVLSIGEQ